MSSPEHNTMLEEGEEVPEEKKSDVISGTAYSRSFVLQCLIDLSRGDPKAEDEGVKLAERAEILVEMLESSAEVCGFVVSIDDVLLTLAGAVEEAEISAFVGEVLNSIAKCETCSDWILRNAEQLFATCVSLFETLRLREVNSAFEVLRSILEKPNLEFGIEWIRWFLQEDTQQRIRFTLLNAPSQLDQLPISILYVLKTLIAVAEEMRRGYEGFLLTMDPKALPSNEEAVQLFLECVDLLDVPLDPSSPLVEFLVEQQSARSGNSLISVMGRLIRKVE